MEVLSSRICTHFRCVTWVVLFLANFHILIGSQATIVGGKLARLDFQVGLIDVCGLGVGGLINQLTPAGVPLLLMLVEGSILAHLQVPGLSQLFNLLVLGFNFGPIHLFLLPK